MNTALWIAQALLFVFFGMAGVIHGFFPVAEAAKNAPWADDVPIALLRFIGISEVAGALGVVLPALTGIKPHLTPLAALGCMMIMGLAAIFHLSRGEAGMVPLNLSVALVAAFVWWGRRQRTHHEA
jgi:putative oxidoreductase